MSSDPEQPAGNVGGTDAGSNSDGGKQPETGTINGNEQPVKRGRGRPRKSDTPIIDPASIGGTGSGAGGDNGTGSDGSTASGTGAKRGRPRKEKAAPISVDAIIIALIGAQFAAKTATGLPECEIGETQTKQLAQALSNVSRHYPPLQLTEKQQDWFMLAYVSGQICVTQYFAFNMRRMKEEREKQARENSNIVDGVFSKVQ